MLLEKNYSLKAFKQNRNILILLTGCFLQKPLKTTAHGLPKIGLACFSSETQKMQAFPFCASVCVSPNGDRGNWG